MASNPLLTLGTLFVNNENQGTTIVVSNHLSVWIVKTTKSDSDEYASFQQSRKYEKYTLSLFNPIWERQSNVQLPVWVMWLKIEAF